MTTDTKGLQPLVDSDVILYRSGFSADSQMRAWYRENVNADATKEDLLDYISQEEYLPHALGNAKSCIEGIAERYDGSKMRLFLTGQGNFREQVATLLPYKGNRDPTHKPKYYKEIKDYLIKHWNAEVVDGMEADDALAIEQFTRKDDSTVICSIDKDLDMVPGHHYNFVKKEHYYIEQDYADTRLFCQMLTGDRTDNIPGITGIGDVKAGRIMEQYVDDLNGLRKCVKDMYRQQYGAAWEGAYYEVGTLLWMKRSYDEEECPLL